MAMWPAYLDNHNGKTMFLNEKLVLSSKLHLLIDEAQPNKFACIYGRQYFFSSFPDLKCGMF